MIGSWRHEVSREARVQDEVKFHTDRAMSELKLASQTANPQVARAHLKLSGLHLDRLRALCQVLA
jgi:hypothetical protein